MKLHFDLPLKETLTIKGMGVEIQSKESLSALKRLAISLNRDMEVFKSYFEEIS